MIKTQMINNNCLAPTKRKLPAATTGREGLQHHSHPTWEQLMRAHEK